MQHGAQVERRDRPGNSVYLSLWSRRSSDDRPHLVDIVSGESLVHILSDLEYEEPSHLLPTYVIMPDGSWEAPDELSLAEALEATYLDRI